MIRLNTQQLNIQISHILDVMCIADTSTAAASCRPGVKCTCYLQCVLLADLPCTA